jgi:hypothetical protein
VIIPIVAMAALIPTPYLRRRRHVRVLKYVVRVIPRVRGRVIEVPVGPIAS